MAVIIDTHIIVWYILEPDFNRFFAPIAPLIPSLLLLLSPYLPTPSHPAAINSPSHLSIDSP